MNLPMKLSCELDQKSKYCRRLASEVWSDLTIIWQKTYVSKSFEFDLFKVQK